MQRGGSRRVDGTQPVRHLLPRVTAKPLLLLDVDGVINDLEAVMMVRMLDEPRARAEQLGVEVIESHGHWLAIPGYMPELIQELAARSETWWCTTWRLRANDEIAAHLGVGPFPAIDDGLETLGLEWKIESSRELVSAAVAVGRDVVWIEDFNGELPGLSGVTYVDTGERGVLRWADVPLDVYGGD